ncbi:MAG: dihydropteroate synthase [Acidobacteria bacterium]|nr:dihydropteroate synthase [Acidobacteriota bacterium]
MGILNVTPDSFSDGGKFDRLDAALAHAAKMDEDGADIIDIGGESTRPDALEVESHEEWRRLEGALSALAAEGGLPVSVDTYKADVARRAAEAGAVMINDVWGMTRDPGMAAAIADTGSLAVVTYNRGAITDGLDLRADLAAFVSESYARADAAGIPHTHILFDPGVGFSKSYQQNLEALANLDVLVDTGRPVLVGVSRKSFIGRLTGRPVEDRLSGTLAVGLKTVQMGAKVLRVHDVAHHRDALDMYSELANF